MKYFAIRKVQDHSGKLFSLNIFTDEDLDNESDPVSEYDKIMEIWSNEESLVQELQKERETILAKGLDFQQVFKKCIEEAKSLRSNLKKFAKQGDFDKLLKNFHDGKNREKDKHLAHGASGREFLQTAYPMPQQRFELEFRNHIIVEFRFSYLRLYCLWYDCDLVVVLGGVIKVEDSLQASTELEMSKVYFEELAKQIENTKGVAIALRADGVYYSF